MKQKQVYISKHETGLGWLFSPATYFVDSYEPQIEQIQLQPTSTIPETVKFQFSNTLSKSQFGISPLARLKQLWRKPLVVTTSNVFIDLRVNSPNNISHAIMMHLPMVLLAKKLFEQELSNKALLLVFPKKLPAYIGRIFDALGFEVLLTDDDVQGESIQFDISFWPSLRGELSQILQQGVSHQPFLEEISMLADKLPKKLFIARKDSRKLVNEQAIENLLAEKGYKKIYAEDYPVLEQIAMVSHAESIVAVHGAALGLMAFRAIFELPPIQLVEMSPPSHMTNVYRILTHQLKGDWVGVRGRLWKPLIEFGYDDAASGAIRKYSLDEFYVCEKSLVAALKLLESN